MRKSSTIWSRLFGEPRDLALRHPLHAELLHQLLHASGRDAGEVGIRDHGHERLLRPPPGLQQPVREVGALPELRHRELDRADPRVPVALAVAVSAVDPLRAPLAVPGAAEHVGVRAHQRLRELLHHRPQQIRARLLELLAQPARHVHRVLDHRAPPRACLRQDFARMTRWSAITRTAAVAPRSPTARAPRQPRKTTSTGLYTTSGDATRDHAGPRSPAAAQDRRRPDRLMIRLPPQRSAGQQASRGSRDGFGQGARS